MNAATPHSSGSSHRVVLSDGRRLHYRRRGSGTPVVVFESGLGFSGATWGLVQPAVSGLTTTVVYDRAGSGGSDDDAAPRTLDRIADDLEELLRTLDAPVILVGHSWGGPIVRTVASRGTADVRGVVLVDQSDENVEEYFTPAVGRRMGGGGALLTFLARTGVYRLFARAGRRQPADVVADYRRDFGTRGARTLSAELREFLPGLRALRDHPERMSALDGLDIVVITGTRMSLLDRAQRRGLNRGHAATAARFPRARLVTAPNSGHNVMFDDPDVVVREITALLGRADEVSGRGGSR